MATNDPTIARLTDPKVGRTPKFTVEEIVEAALECTRIAGLESLTMRSVATALGSSPMTLYRYVADRDELVAATVDEALANLTLPADPDINTLRAWLNSAAHAARDCLATYPGTADHLLLNGPTGPNGFSLMARMCRALSLTGREPSDVAGAYDWLMTTVSVYISKEERMHAAGGGASRAESFHQRFQRESAKRTDGELDELATIVASFTGDTTIAFKRAISAVIDSIVDQNAP